MAEIELENRIIDDTDDEVGIPEVVRHRTHPLSRFAQRVTIEMRKKDGKYAKVNGFKLTIKKDTEGYPQEELEDICEAIMRAVNAKWHERAAQDGEEPLSFRIVFDRRDDRNRRSRPSFELPDYMPDGPDMPLLHDADGVDDRMSAIVDTLGSVLDRVMWRIDSLIEHVIKQSEGHKEMYQPLVQMMTIAHNNQITGMEMQRRAMEYMYSAKRAEEEEAGKDRRAKQWMDFLKKPAGMAIKQFGAYMKARAGGKPDEDEDEDESDEQGAKERSSKTGDGFRAAGAAAAKRESAGKEAPKRSAEPDVSAEDEPLAATAVAFGQMLSPTQWAKAAVILTKKQLGLFAELLEVRTDETLFTLWEQIEDRIPLTKLIELHGILDEFQQQGLTQLQSLIEKAKEAAAAEEAGDAPSGTED